MTPRGCTIDERRGSVSVDGRAHCLDDLPADSVRRLALIGLGYKLRTARGDVWAALQAGLPIGRVGRPPSAQKPLSPWRRAAALALVAEAEASGSPMTMERALTHAAAITAAQLVDLKKQPAVVACWRDLTGTPASVMAVIGPPPAVAATTAA